MAIIYDSKLPIVQGHFRLCNGVRQGRVLSLILFSIYINELIRELEASGFGCYVGHTFYGAHGYADDLTLLALTAMALSSMLRICEDFGAHYDVLFNSKKTVCICLSKIKVKSYPDICFNGEPLKWSSEA